MVGLVWTTVPVIVTPSATWTTDCAELYVSWKVALGVKPYTAIVSKALAL